ncbi:MAG: hypothetical protein H8E64_06375 [Candidatus Marinimicrobia bacterium]|nr:hypothetical protein [Candidatus Neomarinimicrobiota bacterium]
MKNKSIQRILILLILTISTLTGRDYAGYAGSFLRMGTTARSVAMGGGFTAEIDRGFTAFNNPAGVSFLEFRHASFSHQQLPLDRRLIASAFSAKLPPTAGISLAWVSAGVNDIDGRTSSAVHTEYLSSGEDAVYISFAQRIQGWFGVGISIKILNQQLPMNNNEVAGKGIGFDVGMLIKPNENFAAGLMVQDLNSGYQWNTGEIFDRGMIYKEIFPTIYRAGIRFRKWDVDIVGDGSVITNHESLLGLDIRIGTEYTMNEDYFLRAGIGNSRISLGAGMKYRVFKKREAFLDYAFRFGSVAGVEHIFTYAFNI